MNPSKNQLDFVCDVEAGAAALRAQGIMVSKSAEVFEAGGRSPGELSYYASRFASLGHWELLQRLSDAFSGLGIQVPISIRRALEVKDQNIDSEQADSEPETLELSTLPEGPAETHGAWLGVSEQKEPEDILAEVIKTIKQSPNVAQRQKIATMTANWFGV